jgi:hypothetical protein
MGVSGAWSISRRFTIVARIARVVAAARSSEARDSSTESPAYRSCASPSCRSARRAARSIVSTQNVGGSEQVFGTRRRGTRLLEAHEDRLDATQLVVGVIDIALAPKAVVVDADDAPRRDAHAGRAACGRRDRARRGPSRCAPTPARPSW